MQLHANNARGTSIMNFSISCFVWNNQMYELCASLARIVQPLRKEVFKLAPRNRFGKMITAHPV